MSTRPAGTPSPSSTPAQAERAHHPVPRPLLALHATECDFARRKRSFQAAPVQLDEKSATTASEA
eukprot:5547450-Alexandrium_andersonii.AAC.1